MVHIKVEFGELSLRKLIKAAAGKWNSETKLWRLTYGDVRELDLENRIVDV